MAADNRPSWDEYFMQLANDVATRTTCLRRGVGAVIVKDRRILATGYNGVPTGLTPLQRDGLPARGAGRAVAASATRSAAACTRSRTPSSRRRATASTSPARPST